MHWIIVGSLIILAVGALVILVKERRAVLPAGGLLIMALATLRIALHDHGNRRAYVVLLIGSALVAAGLAKYVLARRP
jgi:hypothetical protein